MRLSRTPTYSAAVGLPLLALYEVGILLVNSGSPSGVRNAADVALKEPFLLFGAHYGPLLMLAVLAFTLLCVYHYDTRPHRIPINRRYLGLMMVESMAYAIVFGPAINLFMRSLPRVPFLSPGMTSLDVPTRFVLSLGAGLYEEILFRLILVSALFVVMRYLLKMGAGRAYVAAALLGALLFSGYHHVGPMADPFVLQTFVYRFLAGLALNALYLVRGFGITAYTHAFYDLLVTIIVPLG